MASGSEITSQPQEEAISIDTFSIVGFGSLGRVLSRALTEIGVRCELTVSRTADRARDFRVEFAAAGSASLKEADFTGATLVLITVSDDALSTVAHELAGRSSWTDTIVLHTSGARNHEVLAPLAEKGAHTGSFHPLQTYLGDESGSAFKNVTIGIEGSPQAVATAGHIANVLLAQPVIIESSKKALYHAAAVMTGNHAIAMLAAAEEVWEQAVGSKESFSDAMGPLAERSVYNAINMGPDTALTGPIVRGEEGTLKLHLDAVSRFTPHLLSLYGAIAAETVHLAVRSGRLSALAAVRLLDIIEAHLNPRTEE